MVTRRLKMTKIIIAEDRRNIGKVYSMCLRGEFPNLEVDVVATGRDLIRRVLLNGYDLVIADNSIDGKNDGLEAVRMIRGEGNKVPIYMISASAGIEEEAKESGVDEFSAKPLGIDELIQKSRKYLQ